MTLGTLGAALIVVLLWMCWRDRRGMAIAFAAILLGVIIAGSHGPLGIASQTVIGAIRTAGSALISAVGR